MPRGWQPQYPIPAAAYPNSGVIPRGGASSASRGSGRGGASRGASGSSGRGGGRRASQQVPTMAEVAAPPTEGISLAQVKQFPADQQKIIIGERLYGLIAATQPQLAGKITGMFLESGWTIEELFSLLSDEAGLNQKVCCE